MDYWPTERIWAYVKNDLPKKVSKHPRWKKGVGPLHGGHATHGAPLTLHRQRIHEKHSREVLP